MAAKNRPEELREAKTEETKRGGFRNPVSQAVMQFAGDDAAAEILPQHQLPGCEPVGQGEAVMPTQRREPVPYMNPYVAGVGLGLVLLAAFVVMGRGLGASGAFASSSASIASVARANLSRRSPVITATGAAAPILTKARIEAAMRPRRNRRGEPSWRGS